MIRKYLLVSVPLAITSVASIAQCVMCTKTAASLDDNAARGLNNGIIYLAFMPLFILGFIGFKWWRRYRDTI